MPRRPLTADGRDRPPNDGVDDRVRVQAGSVVGEGGKAARDRRERGSAEHELVLIRTTKAADALPTEGDQASEAGTVGEIPEQKPDKSASHTFKLKPGAYVFICNPPGHYAAGMRGTLTVK
jgi:uncharacterized cupredoxin-like copper-binding protein